MFTKLRAIDGAEELQFINAPALTNPLALNGWATLLGRTCSSGRLVAALAVYNSYAPLLRSGFTSLLGFELYVVHARNPPPVA